MTNESPNIPVTDEELLFFHWQDGLDADRSQEIARVLRSDPALAARYAALVGDLGLLRDGEPAADPAFANRLLAALPQDPDRLAARVTRKPRRRPWAMPLAAAAVLAIAVTLPHPWRKPAPPDTIPELPVPVVSRTPDADRIARQVAMELDSAERDLDTLTTRDRADRERLVAEWILQNRVYAAAAQRAGDDRLARTLRSFEPLLQALASPDSESDGDIRAQLEFEWDMMHTKLRARTSKSMPVRT